MDSRKYFFSYYYTKGLVTGFGSCIKTREMCDSDNITSDDITYVSDNIKEYSDFDKVIILNWKRLD